MLTGSALPLQVKTGLAEVAELKVPPPAGSKIHEKETGGLGFAGSVFAESWILFPFGTAALTLPKIAQFAEVPSILTLPASFFGRQMSWTPTITVEAGTTVNGADWPVQSPLPAESVST